MLTVTPIAKEGGMPAVGVPMTADTLRHGITTWNSPRDDGNATFNAGRDRAAMGPSAV